MYQDKIQPVIESIIQHARYGQQCCISAVPSLTLWHSKQVFQQTRGAQNFSKPFKKHHIYYWVFRLIFHSWFIWCPLDISRAFEHTTHMTISSTLKFTNMPENIIGLIAQNLSKKGGLTGSTQQRSTWVQYFRTKTLQVRNDSTENKLNPIHFLIYYNVQFA